MESDLSPNIVKSTNLRSNSDITAVSKSAKDPVVDIQSIYGDDEGGGETSWVIILTAFPAEHQAIISHLDPWQNHEKLIEVVDKDGTIYTCGNFKVSSGALKVGVVEIGIEKSRSATEATKAISWAFPTRSIFLVGVAKAAGRVKIGDVIIANNISGKTSSYDLEQRAKAEARNGHWKNRIKSKSSQREPSVVFTSIEQEMNISEIGGYSFLDAVTTKNVSAIVIQGVSHVENDLAKKEDELLAADHVSAFVFEMLSKLHELGVGGKKISRECYFPIQNLHDNIIRVFVLGIDKENYRIHVRSKETSYNSSFPANEITDSKQKLFEILQSNESPRNLIGALRRHANCQPVCQPIKKGLNLLAMSNDLDFEDMILEIYDYEELDISWELIDVDAVPLGITYQIVRQFTDQNNRINTYFSYYPQTCQGSVLAHTSVYTSWWNRYRLNFEQLLDHLENPREVHGLIFIDRLSNTDLIVDDPSGVISYSKLLKEQNSIIIIHGQFDFCDSLGLEHQKFIKSFMIHGAKGIIATIDNNLLKEQVTESFFDLLETPIAGTVLLTVPDVLRHMRKKAYEQWKESVRDPAKCSVYLATINYCYYGNPFITLMLDRSNS
jgi:hypothetical protein